MSWTTPEDVVDLWISRETLPTNIKLQTFIDNVEGQIKHAYPAIQTRIDDERLGLGFVKSRIATIIVEFLQTGGTPFQQEAQAYSGAVSRSVTYHSSSRKTLTLTERDLAAFAPEDSGGVFDIDMTPDARVPHDGFYPYGAQSSGWSWTVG